MTRIKLNLVNGGKAKPILSTSDVIVPSDEWEDLQATVDKQRKLLKLFEIQRNEALMPCPKCETITMYHVEDCELAKVLDDNQP